VQLRDFTLRKFKAKSPQYTPASFEFSFGAPEMRRTLSNSIIRKELYQIFGGEPNLKLGID
jgi:hypothetical protein